ncbi:MAG: type II toxin-antitoxin system RelE/ParE family toxin [Magnetococcales bacterium]|nr:type II toxin-antitoxin system RelE/ParE family toxin [Magnetococcales bacterium]
MKVFWTRTARSHLSAIYDYVALHSPEYGKRIVDRLTRRSRQIAQFPLAGRVVPEMGRGQIREVMEEPYRIIYFIRSDRVDVLAVVHGSRKFWNVDGG